MTKLQIVWKEASTDYVADKKITIEDGMNLAEHSATYHFIDMFVEAMQSMYCGKDEILRDLRQYLKEMEDR